MCGCEAVAGANFMHESDFSSQRSMLCSSHQRKSRGDLVCVCVCVYMCVGSDEGHLFVAICAAPGRKKYSTNHNQHPSDARLTSPTDKRLNASRNHSLFVLSLSPPARFITPSLFSPLPWHLHCPPFLTHGSLPAPASQTHFPPPLLAFFFFIFLLLHHLPPPPSPSSSWWVASLTWRWTSSSRRRRASAAWWSCCPTARWRARPRSGACSPPSSARACATCRPAPKSASYSRCCSRWALWTTWSQVRRREDKYMEGVVCWREDVNANPHRKLLHFHFVTFLFIHLDKRWKDNTTKS